MNSEKSSLIGIGIECRVEEVNIFTNNFVTKISADNRVMERIINAVLQSHEISEEFKNNIIKSCGNDCFEKIQNDNSYIWKGL